MISIYFWRYVRIIWVMELPAMIYDIYVLNISIFSDIYMAVCMSNMGHGIACDGYKMNIYLANMFQ